ncbi:molybdopterin-dependent oxidoreductase [Pedobacter sp. MW01-1-1]|uniref:molybdopterin-dependent oxidoreductase n=1 Tax=Pedobacter sp. MW01-1-1 TaxID=3383027 RepID=UPI003FF0C274
MSTNRKSTYSSTCCYCGTGCGILVSKDKKGVVGVEGDTAHPVNKGMLCSKGMNLHYTVNDTEDRLLYPQMRFNKSMPLQRVSWDTAFERTAAIFKTFIEQYGPDSVAFYMSGQCLTEEYYVVNKLMKGFIGSNNIDTNSRLCMSSAVVGYKMALGEDSVPVCYDDIELADCFLVTGANPAWCHPIIWRRVEAHKAANPHVKIIVVDPRRTDTCSLADLHLQLNPGTDITLNNAIGRILIEQGNIDYSFVENHTEGYLKYKESVFERSVEEAAFICGVSVSEIELAAQYIAEAKGFLTMWTMGLNQSAVGVNKNLSLINLNLITGHIGKPGSGPFSLTGQPNAMGGREVGGLANLLPAHRVLTNPEHRAEVEAFWGGGTISAQPGLTATEMFDALESGSLKAIWIMCTNPLVSLPDVRKAEAALKKAKFVVVQEISSKPETLAYADVILPAAAWLEKEGTMTNSERRITHLSKVIDPPGEALADREIICRFAKKMGYSGFDYDDDEAVYKEHAALTKGTNIDVSGVDYQVLKKFKSVQWPYPAGETSSLPKRLFTDHLFYTASQKANLYPVLDKNTSEEINEDYPFILTTGRIRDQWHTMSKTGKVNKLNKHIAKSTLEIHPDDAFLLGISHNDLVEVKSRRGEVRLKANVSDGIKRGVVFLPMHWGKLLNNDLNRANNLTNALLDPISKEPDFKFCAVSVQKYVKAKQRIVIVGAGAGACGFVKSYRALNQEDDIVIFSKENLPFYNRVMLPDYISGTQSWEQLVKMHEAEEASYGIDMKKGVSVQEVDRLNKTVTDSTGKVMSYDVLIMAMGSRPSFPKNIQSLPGIFTMRSRPDADGFKAYLKPNAHVVIVGGGLLGLELAASLCEGDNRVTIIHRSSRFLDRQLDVVGSQMLHDEMIDQGCDIFYNDEVQLINGREKVSGLRLKSGRELNCDAIVFAIGTLPNIELAKECGLDFKWGVTVNEQLKTSDDSIYAIGEIAEFEGRLFGITAAAEHQAEVLAQYLHGDIASYYAGTLLLNIIKVHGFDLCSMGLTERPNSPDYEEIIFIDQAKRYYKKCIIHNDRLVGAILIGDKNEFLEFKELISNKTELSEKRLQLLRSGKQAVPVIGKLVCSCNNVGDGNLKQEIAKGCHDFKELCSKTGAGSGCGSCKPEVQRILMQGINELETAIK